MNATTPPKSVRSTLFSGWVAVAAVTLITVLVIGYQARVATALREENAALRTAAGTGEDGLAEHRDYERLRAENRDLDRLRRDAAELQELRQATAVLRQQLQEIETLRAENQKLRNDLTQVKRSPAPQNYNEAFFDTAQSTRDKALSIRCVNNLKQLGLAVRIWATDHEDRFPTSFLQMSNELGTPLTLLCPADTAKESIRQSLESQRASMASAQQQSDASALFSQLGPSFPSYVLYLSGEQDELYPQRVLAKCPIHGHVGLADGSVQMDPAGSGTAREELVDGRLTLVPIEPDQPDPAESDSLTDPEIIRILQERYGLDPEQLPPPEGE